ncbi:MAG: Asp-tRNA(Asn)/Glu-tRNA(Gln) amidotransferase subunit GatC [Anaerolineales bacterium]|nr:Asp-tRNA(Asn)/Glu-tRNA(Gln) amidotransferase subunit GatC [Anaerolineales bacterium]MCS7247444.1 Asp-tRNA(Asn)/Glu-tRNA(Gln) amidotransferase subunit GatC [Anaerolineales bacterium]MDW8161255.1 Asp-tRNA(Asn)/Glu-tRNA(Gln) amidotransferase subunit GatC [Anaerolineales bacterium]MDW8448284.1 Asp-tRNA(Asn)/Glu-tRNA(Gln) amidotransferase subunit GatC [Anaerolineales bacterium]
MRLTRELVDHIAHLARLGLSEEERERYREQLSAILDHFQRLQELDTEAVPPTFRAVEARRPLRQDEVQPSLSISELLANAPDVEQDQFRVPPILDT